MQVLLFGQLREQLGNTVTVEARTVAEIIAELQRLSPLVSRCRVAVNHEFAPPETILNPSDEVAVIPPVSGG
jgi:molybdopterin converting factor subunit 1